MRLYDDPDLLAALRDVFKNEARLWQATTASIAKRVPKDAACYLYGSSVKGTARGRSDVDLLVIAGDRERANDIAFDLLSKPLRGLQARLHVIAMPASE